MLDTQDVSAFLLFFLRGRTLHKPVSVHIDNGNEELGKICK